MNNKKSRLEFQPALVANACEDYVYLRDGASRLLSPKCIYLMIVRTKRVISRLLTHAQIAIFGLFITRIASPFPNRPCVNLWVQEVPCPGTLLIAVLYTFFGLAFVMQID